MLVAWMASALLLTQVARGEDYYRGIQHALDPLYRLEYEEALSRLSELERRFPEHPGPPLARAATLWLRELFRRQELEDLDRFVSPGYFTVPTEKEMPEEERREFERLVERSREVSQRLLEEDPGNLDARYYLGSAEGILGAYALTIRRSKMDALRHGKQAYQYHKAVVEEAPGYDDAYMTVGTYEYILDNLPWYIKWIAVIAGYTGDEELGFDYLVRAAAEGRFVATDARVLLMVLYVREEQYDYALELARELHRRYPENFLFHLNRGQILEKMGRTGEALEVFVEIERQAAAGAPNYGKLPLGSFRYSLGMELLRADRGEDALRRFDLAAADEETPEREQALSHLRAAEILDRLGSPEAALARYRRVLTFEDFEGSHSRARRRIERLENS